MQSRPVSDIALPAPLLRVENLSVTFRKSTSAIQAVKNVSFSIGAGEIVGLVGESGSGKSVTCRAILRLLPGYANISGSVSFGGRELLALSDDDMRNVRGKEISMVFQNPASHLDPLMTIGRHVAEPLRHHHSESKRQARNHAVDLLQSVHIQDPELRVDAYPHELSGGMKQRGLIASAIACRPRLLLADEPTTALDVTVQARILELLEELNRSRTLAILIVSHNLAVVAQFCSHVIVMRDGAIVEQGPRDQIIGSPQDPYTQQLIQSQPGIRKSKPRRETSTVVGSSDGPAIEVDRLSVRFGKRGFIPGTWRTEVRALDEVSLSIWPGESFGIVGESGSGKSTVARAITRLAEPSSGVIRFFGADIVSLKGAALLAFRRKVQMVFQNPFDSLNPRMTVLQAIAEPLVRHRVASRGDATGRARTLMDLVELPQDLAGRRPRQLSGGQCQRVGIARALALDPEVLIADEITSALDVTIQAQILRLLERLRAERSLTVLYISHDLAVVREFCSRVAVFRGGRLVELGDVEEVLERPRENYTRELIASAPRLDPAVARAVQEDRAF